MVPAYGDTPAAAVNSPLFCMSIFQLLTPAFSSAYPVPWNKYEIGYAWNLSESYADTHLGVTSSQFKALTSSGPQPTIYYAYCAAVGSGVSAPAYISGVSKTISGTAYNIMVVPLALLHKRLLHRWPVVVITKSRCLPYYFTA